MRWAGLAVQPQSRRCCKRWSPTTSTTSTDTQRVPAQHAVLDDILGTNETRIRVSESLCKMRPGKPDLALLKQLALARYREWSAHSGRRRRGAGRPKVLIMLTHIERNFLAAFIHEATTDPFNGPVTEELHRRNIYFADLSNLMAAYYQELRVPRRALRSYYTIRRRRPIPGTTGTPLFVAATKWKLCWQQGLGSLFRSKVIA